MPRSAAKILPENAKLLFPVSTIDSLEQLFRILLKDTTNEPSLGFISILLGILEHSLTCSESALATTKPSEPQQQQQGQQEAAKPGVGPCPSAKSAPSLNKKSLLSKRKSSQSRRNHSFVEDAPAVPAAAPYRKDFPPIELDLVLSLYEQFHALVYSSVNFDLKGQDASEKKEVTATEAEVKQDDTPAAVAAVPDKPLETTRELIRNVSDALWNSLSKSYVSEKPHLQSLYTYLTGNRVDSFGMAITVVAACQALKLNDVHLVLSEDHAWIVFGKDQSCEVTWHGKSAEDKRGEPVQDNGSWLYLKGFTVKCETRHMEVAAIVSAINPSVTGTIDSTEMISIQQRLLWALYDGGHLRKYPMAIGNLADLEEIFPTHGRKSPPVLFEEAINTAKYYYNNTHVYPYTFYGGYLFRKQNFKDALEYWSIGAHVLSQYRFHIKDDEEMYNDFLNITKDQLPSIMKQCSQGISADSITRDPLCYARLLRLFDGICLWEERSNAPIVHITWAKHWISAINKFDSSIRNRVIIRTKLSSEVAACDDKGMQIQSMGTVSASGSTSTSRDLDTFLMHDFPTPTTSVISTLSATATELFCDTIFPSLDSFSSSSTSSSTSAGAFGSTVAGAAGVATPFAELAKASGEILIDPSTLSLISSLPYKGGASTQMQQQSTTGSQQPHKSEANNNLTGHSQDLKTCSSGPKNSQTVAPIVWRKDDDGEPRVILCLFSQKMKSVGELLKANSNTSTLTLALTAQTSFSHESSQSSSSTSRESAGRPRRASSRFQLAPAEPKKRRSEDHDPGVKPKEEVDCGGKVSETSEGVMSLPPKKRGRQIQE